MSEQEDNDSGAGTPASPGATPTPNPPLPQGEQINPYPPDPGFVNIITKDNGRPEHTAVVRPDILRKRRPGKD